MDILVFNCILWINVGIAVVYFAAYIIKSAPLVVGRMIHRLEEKGVRVSKLSQIKRNGYILL